MGSPRPRGTRSARASTVRAPCVTDLSGDPGYRQGQARRHTECTNCRSHGVTGTTATTGGLCGHCSRFQSDWKCLPDRRICRAWDRGSKSIPNGWVMEAKAASKVKPGRSRAS